MGRARSAAEKQTLPKLAQTLPAIRTYDANGNLTYDGRQDLDIQWNIFNLASGAETHDGGSLTFARLSDGTLFSQQKVSGGNTTGKRYCGSFVFTTGTGITTPQGFPKKISTT